MYTTPHQDDVLAGDDGSGTSTAQACFLAQGFLLARILNDASKVAVQWLSTNTRRDSGRDIAPLAKSPALPAVVCQFPAAISPKCLLLKQDTSADVVYLLALTEEGFLYRLVLPAPLYCYASVVDIEASATQYQLTSLANSSKRAICLELLDEDSLLLALDDGSLLKLDQNRLDDQSRGVQLRRHEGQ